MKKNLVCMTLFFALMAGLFLSQAATTAGPTVVRYVDFKVYDPVYVGIEKGFFKKHGIDVRLTGSILGGPTAIQAVASNSAEAGLSSIMGLINACSTGMPVIGVTDIQSALPGQPLEEYFVRKDSGIKSIEDLKGKKIAINLWKSSFHYTAMLALEKAGIQPHQVHFVLLPFDKQLFALENGVVDVVGLMAPYSGYLRKQGIARELFNANDVFGTRQFCLHFVNSKWAKNNRAAARAFVSGIVDSINWIHDNQNEAKGIIAKYTMIDQQYVPDYYFQDSGRVVMSDVRYWIDQLERRGDLVKKDMKATDVATNKYNEAVEQ